MSFINQLVDSTTLVEDFFIKQVKTLSEAFPSNTSMQENHYKTL